MAIDIDGLRNGMNSMDGTYKDSLNVSHRVINELQKMDTSAQLLLQKQSLPKASMDLWFSIIKTLNERHNGFHQALITHPVEHNDEHYPGWEDLKVLAIDVARSSNQLNDELDKTGGEVLKYLAIGGIAAAGLALILNNTDKRRHYQD